MFLANFARDANILSIACFGYVPEVNNMFVRRLSETTAKLASQVYLGSVLQEFKTCWCNVYKNLLWGNVFLYFN